MKKNYKPIRVLISGVGGGSHGLEIMKALRLSGSKYYIFAADISDISLGLFKADKGFIVPAASDDGYIPAMLKICRKEKIGVVIHGSEPN